MMFSYRERLAGASMWLSKNAGFYRDGPISEAPPVQVQSLPDGATPG